MSNCSFHRKYHRGVITLSGIYFMDDFGYLVEVDVPKFKMVMIGARSE